jgi:transposase
MAASDAPRIQTAQRHQLEMRTVDLDATIAADHPARLVWAVVERLDLRAFYAEIRARGATPGRSATDPKLLLALWLYATTDGVGSGRELERLCTSADAYRWLCGGVAVNYHTLNDFRVEHGTKLDDLMAQVLGALTHQGLVRLERVAQDGMRVRADAGAASFRRAPTLRDHQQAATAHVQRLRAALAEDPASKQRLELAAQARAAADRLARLDRALAEMPKVVEVKRRNRARKDKKVSEPRVSTTDPEARVMKMPDGGFRPAYNVQLATDAASRVIVGARVVNVGSDVGQLTPMLDEIKRHTGRVPAEHLVDGGFVNLDAFVAAEAGGVTIYAPVMTPAHPRAPGARARRVDPPAVARWRRRMDYPEAKAIYRHRAATAETTNADLRRWRSLDRCPVRGLAKVQCHVLLNVLAHNISRWRLPLAA